MLTLDADVLSDMRSLDAQRRLLAVQSFTLSESVFSVDVYEQLGELARADPADEVRAAAATALRTTRGRMRASQVDAAAGSMSPALIANILTTAETDERKRLLSALQQRDDPAVLPPIVEALSWETDDRVIAKSLSLVGRHGSAEHVPLVRRYLTHADLKVQATALDAIGALVRADPAPDLVEQLSGLAAGHAQADVRFLARRVVGRWKPAPAPAEPPLEETADAAVAALAAGPDARRAARLIMVVKEKGTAAHAEALKPYLKHADPRVCANAVEAMAALADEEILPALFPLLAREDNRLRANLMVALYPRYPEQVMAYVRRMLRSDKASFRASGLYCAQFLDTAEMYPAVFELLEGERDPAAFTALLDWVAKHGAPALVRRDLPGLAALRVDRAAEVEARLSALGDVTPAPPEPVPTPPAQPAAPAAPPPAPRRTGSTPVLSRSTGSIPLPLPRSTGTHPISRSTSKIPIPAPVVPLWRRIAGHPGTLAGLAVAGLTLAAVLSYVKPPAEERPASQAAAKRAPDRTPHRALVLSSSAEVVEIVMFGSPYRLRPEALAGKSVERGATLWLVEPALKREKDGSGWLTARQVATGETPPAGGE